MELKRSANFINLREGIEKQKQALQKLNKALINLGQAIKGFKSIVEINIHH